MSKADWAERLQNTFAKKYNQGWKDGGLVGIEVGKKQERERIMNIFGDLNHKALSKSEFTEAFYKAVDSK
jgi:hypothetical protein